MWWQNLPSSVYICIILVGILVTLLIEAIRHYKTLKQIPYRIHVNGTRGKSSVARLIAAGLRAGGITTCAKTTGTLARFIDPNGNETAVYRMGHTNIIEQVKVVRRARKYQSQALVIECMALQPLLQSLCELRLVKSTHGVLTNARPDHLDVMGPLEEDVALAMAGTMPVKGVFFTAETKHLPIFKHAAKDRQSELIHIDAKDADQVTDREIAQFSYHEFKENVALALAVCASLGVDKQTALQGMWQAAPDPGAMSIYNITYQQHHLIFANAFAANDPISTETLWHKLAYQHNEAKPKILIVNCRADRHERSAQLGEAIAKWPSIDSIIMIGNGTETFVYNYKKYNKSHQNSAQLINGQNWTVEQLLNHITQSNISTTQLLVGIGNIAGIGLQLVDFFRTHKETSDA